VLPIASFAAVDTQTAAAHKTKAAPTHATSGVVKSVDDATLVITRSGKAGEMTFTLNPSTHREGTISVGAPVSVRYHAEGKTNIATAVQAHAKKS
jgi:hypothetical protein